MIKLLERYIGGFALLVTATAMSISVSTSRVEFVPSLAYGVLVTAALGAILLPLMLELAQWLQSRFEPGASVSSTKKYARSLKIATLLLLTWVFIAGEQLLTELSTKPDVQPVAMVRTTCSVSNSGKIAGSSYKNTASNGDWCFQLTGKSVPESGILDSFELDPDMFSPAPQVGGRVAAWMVSYDSRLFGRSAYVKIVGTPG